MSDESDRILSDFVGKFRFKIPQHALVEAMLDIVELKAESVALRYHYCRSIATLTGKSVEDIEAELDAASERLTLELVAQLTSRFGHPE